jgi:hypothetical protein
MNYCHYYLCCCLFDQGILRLNKWCKFPFFQFFFQRYHFASFTCFLHWMRITSSLYFCNIVPILWNHLHIQTLSRQNGCKTRNQPSKADWQLLAGKNSWPWFIRCVCYGLQKHNIYTYYAFAIKLVVTKSRIESRDSTLMIFRFHLLKTWPASTRNYCANFFILVFSCLFFKIFTCLPTQNRLCEIRLS